MEKYIVLALLLIGIFSFILNWILNKEIDFKTRTVSEYANGPYGYLTTIGFVLIGVGSILVAQNIWDQEQGLLFLVFKWALVVYGVLIASLAGIHADRPNEHTLLGKMHDILASIALILLQLNMIVFLFLTKSTGASLWPTGTLFVTGITSLALFAFAKKTYRGYWERGVMFSQFFWLIYLLL